MDRKTFGENVLKQLDKLNMTQEDLAKKLRKSKSSVYNVINGINSPRYDQLSEYAKFLEMPLIDLMGLKNSNDNSEPEQNKNRLIILSGLTGSGKSHMLYKMVNLYDHVKMIKRYSTRIPMEWENKDSEIISDVSEAEIHNCAICVPEYGAFYACKPADIYTVIESGHSPIIVGGVTLTRPLRELFPESLSIFLMANPTKQRIMMEMQRYPDEYINIRFMQHSHITFDAFSNSTCDYVVINNYDEASEKVVEKIIARGGENIEINGAININNLKKRDADGN